jgi:hypothetical protein
MVGIVAVNYKRWMRRDQKTNVPRKWDPLSSCRGVVVIGERTRVISGSGDSVMNYSMITKKTGTDL